MANLQALREQRGELVETHKGLLAQMQALLDDEGDDGFTEDQQKTFDELEADAKTAGDDIEALDAKIDRRQKLEEQMVRHANPPLAPVLTPTAPVPTAPMKASPLVTPAKPNVEPGILAARVIRGLAYVKKHGYSISQLPEIMETRIGDAWLAKQLNTGTDADGGYLVPTVLSTEIIEILRAASTVLAAGPRRIPMPQGNLTIPAGATGATATYIAEAADIPETQQTFREVVLQAKKLTAIIPITNELLNDASGNVDAFIRDDLVNAMAERSDLAFLRGDGTSNTPIGFLNLVDAANSFAANATVNLQNVTFDLGKAELALLNNNVPLEGCAWFMSHRSATYLRDVRDGNGNKGFPEMSGGSVGADRQRLRGLPVFTTSQIPNNLGVGTDESEIYLANMRHVLVGETGGMDIDSSMEASWFDGVNTVSAFSKDVTLIRARWRHDIDIRQVFCLAHISAVTWGV